MRAGRKIGAVFLAVVIGAVIPLPDASAQITVFETDCKLAGADTNGMYQFVPTCAGRAPSPDNRFAIVQREDGDGISSLVELQDARGRRLDTLPSLNDAMPFTILWAPRAGWFFANHYIGSGLSLLRVFEIVDSKAIERPTLVQQAIRLSRQRYPCLPDDDLIVPMGLRWSLDGDAIILLTTARLDACRDSASHDDAPAYVAMPDMGWKPLWMIGQAATGTIDALSIRVQDFDTPFVPPTDGPYAVP